MRHKSARTTSTNNNNRSEKEKVMRKSFTASLTLVAVLAIAVPTIAAPGLNVQRTQISARENAPTPTLSRVLRLVKRVFGVKTSAEPTMPVPAPTTGT